MTKLLVIKAHPHVGDSVSVSVGNYFIQKYREFHPEDTIETLDLYAQSIPPLNDTTMVAWKHQRQGQELSLEEQELLLKHTKWLNQFLSADKYVFINPMYNFFVPVEMKQYIDVIAVPWKTFKYTEHGPVGLLSNKKILHIQSAGSVYHGTELEHYDFGNAYLKAAFHLLGIDDYTELNIEGVDRFRDKIDEIKKQAQDDATKIAEMF